MTRTIRDLDRDFGRLYAPSFECIIGGRDLVAGRGLQVLSVNVDKKLGASSQFTIVIDGAFQHASRGFTGLLDEFEIGTDVRISMGYRGKELALAEVFTGIITSMTTSFPASGMPQITISGYDHAYCLLKGQTQKPWKDKTDGQVIQAIATEHGLRAQVDATPKKWPRIGQKGESHFQTVNKLAERNGFDVRIEDRTIMVSAPDFKAPPALELEWGRGLHSFSPSFDLAAQVTSVEVVGWDPTGKREIIGRATASKVPGKRGNDRTGAGRLAALCRDEEKAKLRVRYPVDSQQEADLRAKSILKSRSERFVTGEGESFGIPELPLGGVVRLGGFGEYFDNDYHVESVAHTVDASGYRTRFQVKQTVFREEAA